VTRKLIVVIRTSRLFLWAWS